VIISQDGAGKLPPLISRPVDIPKFYWKKYSITQPHKTKEKKIHFFTNPTFKNSIFSFL
jgi:hypothetical protein